MRSFDFYIQLILDLTESSAEEIISDCWKAEQINQRSPDHLQSPHQPSSCDRLITVEFSVSWKWSNSHPPSGSACLHATVITASLAVLYNHPVH